MCDARGKPLPYRDRDKNLLGGVAERYYPARGQRFFLKGGSIDYPKYEYDGPETIPQAELLAQGYKLPFYADLTEMPEMERKAIWGLMVGEEAKPAFPSTGTTRNGGSIPRGMFCRRTAGGGRPRASFPRSASCSVCREVS